MSTLRKPMALVSLCNHLQLIPYNIHHYNQYQLNIHNQILLLWLVFKLVLLNLLDWLLLILLLLMTGVIIIIIIIFHYTYINSPYKYNILLINISNELVGVLKVYLMVYLLVFDHHLLAYQCHWLMMYECMFFFFLCKIR